MSFVFLTHSGVKIAPFKYPQIKPFGAFAITTSVDSHGQGSYPIRQEVYINGQFNIFNWPSAEHAYHGQKIIFLKGKFTSEHPAQKSLTTMLDAILSVREEFKPRDHYDALVNTMLPELRARGLGTFTLRNKFDFDELCEANYHSTKNPLGHKRSIDFMREVVRLKLEQHEDLRLLAMECAQEGVLPVEVSRYDVNWASGPNGEGENLLGILLYEEGARLLKAQGGVPAFEDPAAQYAKLSWSSRAHDVLVKHLNPDLTRGWQKVSSRGLVLSEGQDPEYDYFLSRGGNRRLVINQNTIIGYEYRNNAHSPWQASTQPSRYESLVDAFRATQSVRPSAVDQQENPGQPEIGKITDLIEKLTKEYKSCWPYPNKDMKKEKIKGLKALLENAKIMSLEKAIDKVEEDYPELREGNISTRTADLLDELRNERLAIIPHL